MRADYAKSFRHCFSLSRGKGITKPLSLQRHLATRCRAQRARSRFSSTAHMLAQHASAALRSQSTLFATSLTAVLDVFSPAGPSRSQNEEAGPPLPLQSIFLGRTASPQRHPPGRDMPAGPANVSHLRSASPRPHLPFHSQEEAFVESTLALENLKRRFCREEALNEQLAKESERMNSALRVFASRPPAKAHWRLSCLLHPLTRPPAHPIFATDELKADRLESRRQVGVLLAKLLEADEQEQTLTGQLHSLRETVEERRAHYDAELRQLLAELAINVRDLEADVQEAHNSLMASASVESVIGLQAHS